MNKPMELHSDNRVYWTEFDREYRTDNRGCGIWIWNDSKKQWDQMLGTMQNSPRSRKAHIVWKNGQ